MTLVKFDIIFVVRFYKMFIFVFTGCYFCYMVLQHVLTHTSAGHFFKNTCLFLLVANFILINLFKYNQSKWLMNSLQIIVIISISFLNTHFIIPNSDLRQYQFIFLQLGDQNSKMDLPLL